MRFIQRNSNHAGINQLTTSVHGRDENECERCKSFAEISSKLALTKTSSCVIVDAGKAPMKSLGTTHRELL
jgi:hypothetical protein